MKPPIPYYGGKQRIAGQIVAEFPPHLHYVEPYAGGLSVLLAKPAASIETVNDLDQSIVTFWRVLRDQPDALMRMCTLTPHSRAELNLCREPMDGLTDLEVARRVWSQLAQGRAGRRSRTGWRSYVDGETTTSGMDAYLRGYVRRMPAAAERLARVQLECKPALDVIDLYGRAATTLLYVDPPYLGTTRKSLQYLHEMHDDAAHEALSEALNQTRAQVVLSGYHSQLYDRLYRDWRRVEIAASTQQLGTASASRTEVIWCNFDVVDQLPFDGEAS